MNVWIIDSLISEVLKEWIFEDLIVWKFEWFQGGSDRSWREKRIEGELDRAVLSWNLDIFVMFRDGFLNFVPFGWRMKQENAN